MNCLIVEEEPHARKLLTTFISSMPGCRIAGACRNALEAYDALQTGKADLLLPDIDMPVIASPDFLLSLRNPPMVIFTTIKDQPMREGYDGLVVDLLVKPVTMPRLVQAMDKAWARYQERIFAAAPAPPDHCFVKQDRQLVKVLFSDIRFVEGMHNHIRLHLQEGNMIVSSTMKAFEKLLPDGQFIRIHRTCIVSVCFITAIRQHQVDLRGLQLPTGLHPGDDLLQPAHRGQSSPE